MMRRVLWCVLVAVALTGGVVLAEPRPVHEGATAAVGATRGPQVTVDTLPPAPTTTTTTTMPAPSGPPSPIAGDCDRWGTIFEWYGASSAERRFFFDGGIIWRETRCGLDNLNERSGDSGPCQINPVHNRAGYFGGRYFGDGGWLYKLHGLRTRQDVNSTRWVPACLTLYRVCSSRPWQPPYGCANRSL